MKILVYSTVLPSSVSQKSYKIDLLFILFINFLNSYVYYLFIFLFKHNINFKNILVLFELFETIKMYYFFLIMSIKFLLITQIA